MSDPWELVLQQEFGSSPTLSMQASYRFTDLHLYELPQRLSVLGGPEFQLQFPSPVSPFQAGVGLTFLEWNLPRIGPFALTTTVEAAASWTQGEGYELSSEISADLSLARVRWLELHVFVEPTLSWAPGGPVHADVGGGAQINVTFEFDRGQFRLRR